MNVLRRFVGSGRSEGSVKEKKSELWCEKVNIAVKDKKGAFEKYLGTKKEKIGRSIKEKRGQPKVSKMSE